MNRKGRILHIGAGYWIDTGQIVGIFDLDKTTYGKITRAFLAKAEQAGQVIAAGEELPKSFLLCEDRGVCRVYLSQLAATTLQKRILAGEERNGPDGIPRP